MAATALASLISCGEPAVPHTRSTATASASAAPSASPPPTPASATVNSGVASVAEGATEEDIGAAILAPHPAADLFAELPTGEAQRQILCARGNQDRISRAFCSDPPPIVGGLRELETLFGLDFKKTGLGMFGNAKEGNPAFVFLGHTTALTARIVSPINPRAIVFTPPVHGGRSDYFTPDQFKANPDFVAMAYTRGEQIVEMVARDPASGDLRFFVVRYEQACNAEAGGCDSYDLFTPATERDWRGVTVYEDVELRNTPADCNVCHQPNGHGTKRVLLMQAIRTPWTHFFRQNREGGNKLYGHYRLAHGEGEPYGGIPGSEILYSDPARLEGLVENEGFIKQAVELPAAAIEQEIQEKGLKKEPYKSIAFFLLYKKLMKGEIPGLEYATVDVVDESRMLRAAKAYRAVLGGKAPREKAPWLGDLLLPEVTTHVGLAPKPGMKGREILVHMCRRCHNSSRDPGISRARFNIDKLDQLSDDVLERALRRIALPFDSGKRMPPPRFALLSDNEIAVVAEELRALIERKGPNH